MKIKLMVAWQTYKMGETIDPPAAQAQLMVMRGFAEYVKAPARKVVREVLTAGRNYVAKA